MHIGMFINRKVNSNMYYLMLVAVCLYVFFVGQYVNEKNTSLVAVLILFVGNIIFSLKFHKSTSIFFILYHFMIFLFILSRATIAMLRGDNWQYYFTDNTIYTVLLVLLLSLSGLYEGAFFGKKDKKLNKSKRTLTVEMKKIIFAVTLVCLCAEIWKEFSSYLSFSGNYVDLYLAPVQDNTPMVVSALSGMCLFFLIIYLASNPSKNKSLILLVFYVVASIPSLLMGARNVIMLRVMFAGSYFLLRELCERRKKWVGRKEITFVIMLIPILIIALGTMNYTREEQEVPSDSVGYIIEDFFYKQGTSFDTLIQTVEYKDEILTDTYINFTFGDFFDFVLYNGISNKIFGTTELEYGNGINKATVSNSLAHRVSYVVLGDIYLEGHGRGTTYFSELYLDFGYFGVLLFNIIIGIFWGRITQLYANGFYSRIILLNILVNIFLIPRMSFSSSISFVINYYFWIVTIIAVVLNKAMKRLVQKYGPRTY